MMMAISEQMFVGQSLMQEIAERAGRIRYEHIEMLAAAFMTLTKLPADQCEVVEQMDGQKMTWHVRQRGGSVPFWREHEAARVSQERIKHLESRIENPITEEAYQYLAKRVESLIQQNDELKRELEAKKKAMPHVMTFKDVAAATITDAGTIADPEDNEADVQVPAESPVTGKPLVLHLDGQPEILTEEIKWNWGEPAPCTCKSLLAGHESGCPHSKP